MTILPTPVQDSVPLHRRLRSGESLLKSGWTQRKYVCPDCERVFSIRATLVRHRIYECEGFQPPQETTKRREPQKPTKTALSMKQEKKKKPATQNTNGRPGRKKKTAKTAGQKKQSKMVTVKTKGKRTHTCPDCRKTYSFVTSLWRHRNYECRNEPKFACQICAYKFSQKGNLERHMRAIH